MDVRVLGPLELAVDGAIVDLGAPKQRAVFAALLVAGGRPESVDRLIDAVWGDAAPRTARHSVQLYVSDLRRAMHDTEGQILRTRAPGYELDVSGLQVDADRFERKAAEGLARLPDDPAAALAALDEALGLWRGAPYADVMYLDFAQPEVRRLETLRLDTADARDEARLRLGLVAEALADLTRRVHEHPLRERTRGLHMQGLAGMGRQADALRSYRDLEVRLAEELGIAPSADIAALERRILMQEPSTVLARSTRRRNPFKGLRHFDERDRGDYTGRDAVVERLFDSVMSRRVTAIVGPSGSGKSSIVRAGLVPRMRESGYVPVVMVPGAVPCEALRRALAAEGIDVPARSDCGAILEHLPTTQGVLLVVDQLEEMYLGRGAADADGFLADLAGAVTDGGDGFRLVVVVRADFSDRPLGHGSFGPMFGEGMFALTPMGAADLERAATGPAMRSGVDFDGAVISQLVADVVAQPGYLPMFQFSLTDLVDRGGDGPITMDLYREVGGVEGALVERAETALAELDAHERAVAQQLSLRLVALDGEVPLRRRLAADDLLSDEFDGSVIRRVLEVLAHHRLVTFDRNPATGEPTVEFAHDSLLTRWTRLAGWIEDGRDDIHRGMVLATEVAEWVESGESEDFLPTGARLAAFEEWRRRSALHLTREELRFIEAARGVENERIAGREAREAHAAELSTRARRRLWLVTVLTIALAIFGVGAILAGGVGPRVALVYDGREAGNWGELAASGWDRSVVEFGIEATEFTPLVGTPDEIESLLDQGNELVVVVGFEYALSAMGVMSADPSAPIVVIDSPEYAGIGPSYVFASEEGSFLAGAAAAMSTETGVVGFVGGMPSDLIEAFRAGFEAGAHHVDPEVEVVASHIASVFDPRTAFTRPDLGQDSAEVLIDRGADVIFHAAGISGLGVLDAAIAHRDAGGRHVWVIGVDVDEYLQASRVQRPHILTSMIKRVDLAVERAVTDHFAGVTQSDPIRLGLADGAFALARSGGFIDGIADDIDQLAVGIVAGEIRVPSEPVGSVIRSEVLSGDIDVTITYGSDRSCGYEGPSVVTAGLRLGLNLVNDSDERAFLGFVPLAAPMTLEEVAALPADDGSPPPELDLFESFGLLVDGGSGEAVVSPALADRTYAVFCTGTEPIAAAVVDTE